MTNVKEPRTISLEHSISNSSIYALSIEGSGYIDGVATMVLILNGDSYRAERISGTVDFAWGGDWYSDLAEIRYVPIDVTSGSITLHYEFKSI